MSEKFVNFKYDEDNYQRLKELALRERKNVKIIMGNLLDDYLKKHADGNPQYKLDQFDDPNFMACPAFYRPVSVWETYIKNADDDERMKLKEQIVLLDKTLWKYL